MKDREEDNHVNQVKKNPSAAPESTANKSRKSSGQDAVWTENADELLKLAKDNGNALDFADIRKFFADTPVTPEDLTSVYNHLEESGVAVLRPEDTGEEEEDDAGDEDAGDEADSEPASELVDSSDDNDESGDESRLTWSPQEENPREDTDFSASGEDLVRVYLREIGRIPLPIRRRRIHSGDGAR